MEKEFIPYELAVKMKALGFDEPCFGVFELIIVGDTIPKFRYNFDSEGKWFNHNKVKDEYNNHDWYWSAPTFSQAFRWFREKHDLYHVITIADLGKYESGNPDFQCAIYSKDPVVITKMDNYKTYEEAELACLDKLLEIVESKKESDGKTTNCG